LLLHTLFLQHLLDTLPPHLKPLLQLHGKETSTNDPSTTVAMEYISTPETIQIARCPPFRRYKFELVVFGTTRLLTQEKDDRSYKQGSGFNRGTAVSLSFKT